MIELKDVSLRHDDTPILQGIDLVLAERRIAIVGANGSGKSSLARLLNGLRLPSSGAVVVDGLDTRAHAKAVRRKVGFVFQNPDNQIVLPTVEEDLAFGLKNLKLPAEAIARKVDEALGRYDLRPVRKLTIHKLSGGQKQLVAIAGVLAMDPDYVVLDEPMTLLDLRNKKRIAEAIDTFRQTAIVVSHDLDFVRHFDRAIVMDRGAVVADDAPDAALLRYVERMT